MKTKSLILSFVIFFSLINFSFAQNVDKTDRGPVTECRKMTQTLWAGKTALGSKRQQWLIYEVSRLQKLLDKLGYFGPKPEFGENYDIGYYDTSTKNAVKKYQEENLPWATANGSVGPKTLEFINKYEFCNSDRRFSQLVFDKTFTIPYGKFSFKYPSSEFLSSFSIPESVIKKLESYLDVCSIGEFADPAVSKNSLCYKRNRDGELTGAALTSNILTDKKTEDKCLVADEGVKSENIDDNVMINGMKFYMFKTTYRELGHEVRTDVYKIFKNDKCYEFKLSTELARVGVFEDDEELLKVLDLAQGRMRAALETIEFTK